MGVNWAPVAPKSHALSEPAGESENPAGEAKKRRIRAFFTYNHPPFTAFVPCNVWNDPKWHNGHMESHGQIEERFWKCFEECDLAFMASNGYSIFELFARGRSNLCGSKGTNTSGTA